MNRPKQFDCVEMKREIQEMLRKEYAGMPEAEARLKQWEKVLRNPLLGPLVVQLQERQRTPSRSK